MLQQFVIIDLECLRQQHQSFIASAGLSVAKIDQVSGDTVVFTGADVVDGTPVLDIKPYLPYVDGGVDAQAPAWVGHQHQ